MKLGTLRTERGPRVIVVSSSGWLDVGEALGRGDAVATDLQALIASGEGLLSELRRLVQAGGSPGRVYAPDETRLAPPIAAPGKILCIGLNYSAHAAEWGSDMPLAPEIFLRVATSLVGPRDDVWMPPDSEQMDLEAELAVVIGAGGRRISKERALDAVFGWTVFNDVSIRDLQKRGSQWTPGKNFDRSGPLGPFVVTRDEVADPIGLEIASHIDDEGMQRLDTGHMVFDIRTLIADISSFTTLQPGDVIATGTPPGVGVGRVPPRWVKVGETMRCSVEGIGELRNLVVAEPGVGTAHG